MARRRIGVLGGSFNPAHDGHLHISLLALRRLGLDQVWWMVSPQNPLKSEAGMADFAERLAGARRRALRHPAIRVTDIERRLGSVHTVESLSRLKRRFPGVRFVWLMGADNLVQLPRWRRWQDLFSTVPIAVFARPSYSLRALSGKAARAFARFRQTEEQARSLADAAVPAWVFLHSRPHPASATQIRADRPRRPGEPWDNN